MKKHLPILLYFLCENKKTAGFFFDENQILSSFGLISRTESVPVQKTAMLSCSHFKLLVMCSFCPIQQKPAFVKTETKSQKPADCEVQDQETLHQTGTQDCQ